MIVYGNHTLLDPEDSDVYAYIRTFGDKSLLTIANFTNLTLERTYEYGVKATVINNYSNTLSSLHNMMLKPYQALVIEI
ncbi:alpha-glucosidase AglA [Vibrio maritimus]|uniref:Alpha-glucosidase AglA n=1 Tax=Vibrio maritimus TaxID=990268 RepID=A0A090RSB3_9VIBR|nr:alpha-glucosidase AglA [Vibrio maritimus]